MRILGRQPLKTVLPFPGSKRRATNKGASQRVRGKHQKVGDSLRMDEPEVGNKTSMKIRMSQFWKGKKF